jgi:hypothetical protein
MQQHLQLLPMHQLRHQLPDHDEVALTLEEQQLRQEVDARVVKGVEVEVGAVVEVDGKNESSQNLIKKSSVFVE